MARSEGSAEKGPLFPSLGIRAYIIRTDSFLGGSMSRAKRIAVALSLGGLLATATVSGAAGDGTAAGRPPQRRERRAPPPGARARRRRRRWRGGRWPRGGPAAPDVLAARRLSRRLPDRVLGRRRPVDGPRAPRGRRSARRG